MSQTKVLLAGNESLDRKKTLTGRKSQSENKEKPDSRYPKPETRDPIPVI